DNCTETPTKHWNDSKSRPKNSIDVPPQLLLLLLPPVDKYSSRGREGAWEEWLTFFLRGVASQAQDAVARAWRMQNLRERYREQFQTARTSARLLQTVDLLFARPILTVGHVVEKLGVTTPTAQGYVDRLEEAGILREITGQARNRVYRADEVLETIEAPLNENKQGL
ncbi:MAG: helix-turn-helix domain-containing protein, partial [Chloroflexota bacterium]|nr:helix-turn-helix domain-containing protein [Chloroflexota bacterium]